MWSRTAETTSLLGRFATSRSGRDVGTLYLVIGTAEPASVLVADGRSRGVARPKRKNLRHLTLREEISTLAPRLAAGQAVTDEEIRSAIAALAAAAE